MFEPQPFETTSAESLDRQWALNVRAPFLLTQAALPHLVAALGAGVLETLRGETRSSRTGPAGPTG